MHCVMIMPYVGIRGPPQLLFGCVVLGLFVCFVCVLLCLFSICVCVCVFFRGEPTMGVNKMGNQRESQPPLFFFFGGGVLIFETYPEICL